MYAAYCERREWPVPALNALPGICCAGPDGAFYVSRRQRALRQTRHRGLELVRDVLEEARRGRAGHRIWRDESVRISSATSMERIREGVARIDAALRKL
jgi:aspartate/methionine/tyrosine aminotransferase